MSSISIVPSAPFRPPDFFNFLQKRDRVGKVSIREDRQNYLVTVELPGFITDDININFSRGILNIFASSYVTGRSPTVARCLGRSRIHKSVKITGNVDEEHISYLYEGKILRIWLPKKDATPSSFKQNFVKRLKILKKLKVF